MVIWNARSDRCDHRLGATRGTYAVVAVAEHEANRGTSVQQPGSRPLETTLAWRRLQAK